MRRITKVIVAVVAVSALLVITCPSKERHKTVIKNKVTELIKNELSTEDINTENPFVKILSAAGVQLLDIFIEQNLEVKNYVFFSVAKTGDPAETISIGVLGMVFFTAKDKNISLGTTDFKYTIDDGLDLRL
jgi:H+/gluconate symporter-like permease